VRSASDPLATKAYSPPHRHIGPKAFYLEPWLILGASLLWAAVLPLGALVWSGTALAKGVGACSRSAFQSLQILSSAFNSNQRLGVVRAKRALGENHRLREVGGKARGKRTRDVVIHAVAAQGNAARSVGVG
jgi:hypothetical protein